MFCSGIALAIRPAAIWMGVVTLAILLYYLLKVDEEKKIRSIKSIVIVLLLVSIAYILPLLPQIYIRYESCKNSCSN